MRDREGGDNGDHIPSDGVKVRYGFPPACDPDKDGRKQEGDQEQHVVESGVRGAVEQKTGLTGLPTSRQPLVECAVGRRKLAISVSVVLRNRIAIEDVMPYLFVRAKAQRSHLRTSVAKTVGFVRRRERAASLS